MFDRSLGMFQPPGSIPFQPGQLFAAGEQGVWYDPSDFSTMFQDSAGTTPVTAIEQPVGLILDKRNGLALGSELVTNGNFSNGTTGWFVSGAGGAGESIANVNNQLVITGGVLFGRALTAITTVAGRWYRASVNVVATSNTSFRATNNINGSPTAGFPTASISAPAQQTIYFLATATTTYLLSTASASADTTIDNVTCTLLSGNHASQSTTTSRPILRNLYNLLICQTTMATQNVTTLAASYTLRFTGTGTVTLSGTATGTLSAGSNAFTATAGTLTLTVSGTVSSAMLTPTNEASLPFQSVTSNTLGSGVYDTDLTKFKPYLFFDGSDDWLQTANINFSATDNVSVFTGLRKLSDAAQDVVVELSATIASNNGTFLLSAPSAAAANYSFSSKGTSQVDNTVTTFASPITNVVTGLADISSPVNTIRVNGAATTLTTSQGTGNYGAAYPLYIGRRGGTTLSFVGRIYSLIVRGALTSSPQLEQTETWVNSKTGAY